MAVKLAHGVDPLQAAVQAARGSSAQLRRRALEDPVLFQAAVMRDEVTGAPFLPADVHCDWQDLCTTHDRLVLWAAIEHGKSASISIGRVLFEIAKNPGIRVGICTNTGGHNSLGVKLLRAIKQYIEKSPELHEVAPRLVVGDYWTQTAITVARPYISKDPTVQVFGLHGDVMGARLDLIIFDDVLDWEVTRTKAQRDATSSWIDSTVLGRLVEGGRVWAIGNPWDPDDAYHRLAKRPGWSSHTFAANLADGSPRWPARWSLERLARKRADLGPSEAARQLDCRSRSDESSRFQEAWVNLCLARGDGRQMQHHLQRVPLGCRVLTGVDLGVQEKDANDPTAIMDVLIHGDGTRELLCIESGKWAGPVIVSKILDHYRRYQGYVWVENNAAQDFIVQFTQDAAAIPIRGYTTGRTKAHPEFGVEKIAAEMSNAKWIIPNIGRACHPEVEGFVNECLFYHPAAHTGDRLMAAFFIVEGERLLDAGGEISVGKWTHRR